MTLHRKPIELTRVARAGIAGAIALCAALRLTTAAGSADPSRVSLMDASVRARIAAAVERNRRIYGGRTPLPGVLVSVSNPSGSFERGFGYERLESRTPMRVDDHFRIGSNTKVFVVTVLLQLADEGKLKFDDPLSRFDLGVKIPNARNITVRELCEMRSGLFEAYDTPQIDSMHMTGSSKFDPRTMVRWAVQQKPYFPPGTKYRYTNTNYLLLGLIVETLTHDTIENQIRTRILQPFGLHQTSFPTTQAMPSPWAHGYGLDAHKNWVDVSGTIPVSLMWAAGAMISDAADMNRWVKLYVEGKTNSAKTQRERMHCLWTGEGNLYYGLGFGCSAGWFGYTGGLPGYNTATYYFPATDTVVTAWVDVQTSKPSPAAANAIFRDIARIVTPGHVPFVETAGSTGKSGL